MKFNSLRIITTLLLLLLLFLLFILLLLIVLMVLILLLHVLLSLLYYPQNFISLNCILSIRVIADELPVKLQEFKALVM